jgi:hypothetical protein
VGYGLDIYKLALLNDSQRNDLIAQLKVLPGHKAKLMSLFDVIDELYPKKIVAEQLKQFTTPSSSTTASTKQNKFKRANTASNTAYRVGNSRQNAGIATQYNNHSRGWTVSAQNPRSLLHQYENLDPHTKQAFNSTFLMNLESVKYSIPQLFQQHFPQQDTMAAINYIFPPSYFQGPNMQYAAGYG